MPFVVIYRTGGTENFKWHPTLGFATLADASKCLRQVRRQGYLAFAVAQTWLDKNGLPTTFEGP